MPQFLELYASAYINFAIHKTQACFNCF